MGIIKTSTTELITLSIVSLVLQIIGMYEQIADRFFLVPDVRNDFEAALSDRFDVFLKLIDQLSFSADLITGLVWSIFGSFLFIIIWLVINVVSDLKNNIKVSVSFRHPKSFHQSTFWGAYVIRVLFKAAVVVLIVASAVLFFTNFLPVVFTAEQLIWNDSEILARIIGMAAIWLILVVALHLFVVFSRLLSARNSVSES